MDNLTHSLMGLTLARAGLDKLSPRSTFLLLLSANAPDLDIVALSQGQFAYLEAHRGITHTFVALPILALACVCVVAAVCRQRLPWVKAWLLCCAGLVSHLLLDWTNSYGIRPFFPFLNTWFYLDLNALYDWVILTILVAALVWPLFSRLVGSEIGEKRTGGRGHAVCGLVLFLLFDMGRALLHQRAVGQLEARLYEGTPPLSTAALPEALNPFRWTGVVEAPHTMRLLTVDTLGQLDSENAAVFYKPQPSSALQNAAKTPQFRYFLYFSRFPIWAAYPLTLDEGEGSRIDLTDLRFGAPGVGGFHCIAVANAQGRILHSWFTFGTGDEFGRGAKTAP